LSEDYLYEVTPASSLHLVSVTSSPIGDLTVPNLDPGAELREPTFFERLADFNPLRRDDNQAPTPTPTP